MAVVPAVDVAKSAAGGVWVVSGSRRHRRQLTTAVAIRHRLKSFVPNDIISALECLGGTWPNMGGTTYRASAEIVRDWRLARGWLRGSRDCVCGDPQRQNDHRLL